MSMKLKGMDEQFTVSRHYDNANMCSRPKRAFQQLTKARAKQVLS